MIKQGRFILLSFLMGILFTYLFFQHAHGISFLIFAVAFIAFLAYSLKQADLLKKDWTWLFAVPILLLSARYFLSANVILNILNFPIIVVLSIGMSVLLANKKLDWGKFNFVLEMIEKSLVPIAFFHKPYQYIYEELSIKKSSKLRGTVLKIFMGILISLPLLLIILVLLASADAVFSHMLTFMPQLFGWIDGRTITNGIFRIILTILSATYLFAFMYVLLKPNNETVAQKLGNLKRPEADSTILITVLSLVNIIYILFCVIQFSYLFAVNSSLPGGISYSEYARKGFFELIFVTIINFSIILDTLYFTENKKDAAENTIKTMLLLIGGATFVMLYSSFYRMGLYQQNYGYTYLRIFVNFCLSVEAITLVGTMLYIIKKNFSLMKMYIVTFVICFIVLNYINIDKIIVSSNIEMYNKTGKIDFIYLTGISEDGMPQIATLLNSKDENLKIQVKNYLIKLKSDLQRPRSWVEFNYARYKALRIVERIK